MERKKWQVYFNGCKDYPQENLLVEKKEVPQGDYDLPLWADYFDPAEWNTQSLSRRAKNG